MKIFLDTNIIMDFVFQRGEFFESAKKVLGRGLLEKDDLYMSALTLVTTLYVSKRYNKSVPLTKDILKVLATFVKVVDLTGENVVENLSQDWKDYEDSTQYGCAVRCNADLILTRNAKDFEPAAITVKAPNDYLASLL